MFSNTFCLFQHNTLEIHGRRYTILKMIGEGGSSKVLQSCSFHCVMNKWITVLSHPFLCQVYQVLDEDSNMLAVKCVNLNGADESTLQSYKNEIDLLRRLQYSDFVVKLYDR